MPQNARGGDPMHYTFRTATREDVPLLLAFIRELADY